MPGVILLAAAVVTNYVRHRMGRPTICQHARATLPRPLAIGGVAGVFGWLIIHLWNGYPAKR